MNQGVIIQVPWAVRDPLKADKMELYRAVVELEEWQAKAIMFAHNGEFDKLADHLNIPNPTVSPGQYIRLSEDSDEWFEVSSVINENIECDCGMTCTLNDVYEVRDEV